jgi:hypothetical protein
LVLLWATLGIIDICNFAIAPGEQYISISALLLLSTATLLSALLAAWVIQRKFDAIRLGNAFLLAALPVSIIWLAFHLLVERTPLDYDLAILIGSISVCLWWSAAALKFLKKSSNGLRPGLRAGLAVLGFFVVSIGAVTLPGVDSYMYALAYAEQTEGAASEDYVQIDPEELWGAQPGLVSHSLAGLAYAHTGPARPFVLSVAAGGSQQLFGREAKAMARVLVQRFGSPDSGILLSNAQSDLGKVPLATQTNLAVVLNDIGKHFDSRRGMMIVFLTSHGSRSAELQTNLPDYTNLKAISARGLAAALDKAGIRRRIVIVSACYSGSWIKPLASPDTIVITAAAADRTSFGCDDTRQYTLFGEKLIESGLRPGTSLQEVFEGIKTQVAKEEEVQGVRASMPQVFVGQNMQAIWTKKG